MEALRFTSFNLGTKIPIKYPKTQLEKSKPIILITQKPSSSSSSSSSFKTKRANFSLLSTALSSSVSTEPTNPNEKDDKFDWYAQWYPVMPVCDLDKRAPYGKRVMGIDIVVWWDKNENSWKVFEDMCPHRLAPLSEGRIDQWGRLQCVYHGWCFSGNGDCKFIPQAPPDGPPVHTFKKACAVAYPSTVQNDIVWFWPNSDPQYKNILSEKKPPFIPELDDPSYTKPLAKRDLPYGYEVLIENLMDPAHVYYAHYGIMPLPKRKESEKADREGGRPSEFTAGKVGANGFSGNQVWALSKFMAPCVFYVYPPPVAEGASQATQRRFITVAICVPVSPGHSRIIWSFPRNFGVWIDKIIPRWIFHMAQNLVLDSDLRLLHAEERKIKEFGPSNWQKICFVPTKSDAQVVAFRRWLNEYAGGQVDWRTKFSTTLPPTPPREQLLDRYWTHVVNCRSCSVAYKGLNALEIALQVLSVALIGIIAATKHKMLLSVVQRSALISVAVLCFVGSRWLSHFVYKNFRFHDYYHAFR